MSFVRVLNAQACVVNVRAQDLALVMWVIFVMMHLAAPVVLIAPVVILRDRYRVLLFLSEKERRKQ